MGNACVCGKFDDKKSNRQKIVKNPTKEGEVIYESKPISIIITTKVIKSICQITIKKKEEIIYGTGFFIKLSESLKYLFTNYLIINPNSINVNIELEKLNKKNMNLILNERHIKYFEKPKDVTVIQIKETDKIYEDIEFLDYDLNYMKGYLMYENADIFSLKNPVETKTSCINGKVLNINNDEFEHNIPIENDSSGCPIIILNNDTNINSSLQVIDINKYLENNKGIFINEIINEIINGSNLLNSPKIDSKIDSIDFSREDPPKDEDPNLIDLSKNENEKINLKRKIYNKKNTINKNKGNFIIGEIYIKIKDINKPIRIINSYEEYMQFRNYNLKYLSEDLKNENEIKECEITINNELIKFDYFHEFESAGKYIIKYTFNNLLTKTNFMFCNCYSLININLSNLKTENITNMSHMFYQCSSLLSINLSYFITEKVNDMSYMFCNCSSLTNLDLSYFNTQNVTDMSCMFCGCNSLVNIDLSSFNTQNVIAMNHMFSFCSSLKNLDLSKFTAQNVSCMCNMFYNCSALESIDLSNFNTEKVPEIIHCCNQKDFSCIFLRCSSLKAKNIFTQDKKISEILEN